MIIGATGTNSVTFEDLKNLKHGCHLISISSSDREFPSQYLRTHAVSGKEVHDTYVCKMSNIHLANGGFPISFKGERIECYPLEMDVTMMKLSEGILQHTLGNTEIGFSINNHQVDLYLMRIWRGPLYAWYAILIIIFISKILFFGLVAPSPVFMRVMALILVILGPIPGLLYFLKLKKIARMI